MSQLFTIARRNLISHRGRTLILGGAIALVTCLMVFMMALTRGIKARMIENATALSTGHVNVGGFLKISQSSAAPIVTQAARVRELLAREVPEATLIVDRVRAYGKIISDTNSIMVPITGINMATEKRILGGLNLARVRDYVEAYAPAPGAPEAEGSMADLEQRGGLAIFASHARKLKARVGDVVTVSMPTYRNVYNTKDVRIAAILQDLGMISSFTMFMHHEDVREIYDMAADTTSVFQIYLPSLDAVPAVEDRLRKALSAASFTLMDKDANPYWMKFERVAGESWTGQRLDLTNWEDETSFLKWVLDIFNALTFALTFVLMVIIVIGLMNNMWMAIRERTSEIGTMRAVGLQRRGVLVMFLLESLLLATASVGIGIVAGSLLATGVAALEIPIRSDAFVMFFMSNSLWLQVGAGDLAFTFVLLSTLLMVGALLPAYRASKLEPITAINHVN